MFAAAIVVASISATPIRPAEAATRTPRLDMAATRVQIAGSVWDAYPGLGFVNAACPAPVPRRAGERFTCSIQLRGTFLLVDAEQTDAHGSLRITSQQAVIARDALQKFIAGQTTLPGTVNCGPAPWIVARPGQKLTCTATLADGVRTVEVTVRDTNGTVTITGVR